MDPDSKEPLEMARVEGWIQDARRGDARAFNHLVDRYSHALFSLAYRNCLNADEARESCQEAWLSAWRAFERYDGDAKGLHAWLARIVINASRDRLRYEQRRPQLTLSPDRDDLARALQLPGPDQTPQDFAEAHELGVLLDACLARLSPEHREVLLLDKDEFDYNEIAAILQVELGTVKSRMSRARAHMRDMLNGSAPFASPRGDMEPNGTPRRFTSNSGQDRSAAPKPATDRPPGPPNVNPS